MALVLVRHLPVALEKGICYGRTDVPLSIESQRQVPAFARQLTAEHGPFQSVFTSPRQRCRFVAEALSVTYTIEPALAEMDFGRWEGKRWTDIPSQDLDEWTRNVGSYAPGGGESMQMMADRLIPWLEKTVAFAQREHMTILAVTHGGPIRVALALARQLSLDKAMDIPVGFGWAVRFG